tara:strand:+ start:893 stop:1135 length:243 start_codon:yes stop_codon:yes gene_type:complete
MRNRFDTDHINIDNLNDVISGVWSESDAPMGDESIQVSREGKEVEIETENSEAMDSVSKTYERFGSKKALHIWTANYNKT